MRIEHPWVLHFWFFGLGACVGSFLNVCILRIPAGLSIVTPGSHCICGKPIRWFDNIPIFSWFILRGRARCCGQKFSIRYSLVEAVTAGVFVYLAAVLPLSVALPGMIFFSLLLMGALIDIDHMILPDITTVGGMFVGVILSCLIPQLHGLQPTGFALADMLRGGGMAVIGVAAGTTIIFWTRELGELALKREAMGYGDILLMGCIGAFCGWQGAIFAVIGGAFIGLIFLVPMMLWARMTGKTPAASAAPANESAVAKPANTSIPTASGAKSTEGEGIEAAPSAVGFGVEVPFGHWLALGAFLYFAIPSLHQWFNDYLSNMVAMVRNPLGGV